MPCPCEAPVNKNAAQLLRSMPAWVDGLPARWNTWKRHSCSIATLQSQAFDSLLQSDMQSNASFLITNGAAQQYAGFCASHRCFMSACTLKSRSRRWWASQNNQDAGEGVHCVFGVQDVAESGNGGTLTNQNLKRSCNI